MTSDFALLDLVFIVAVAFAVVVVVVVILECPDRWACKLVRGGVIAEAKNVATLPRNLPKSAVAM